MTYLLLHRGLWFRIAQKAFCKLRPDVAEEEEELRCEEIKGYNGFSWVLSSSIPVWSNPADNITTKHFCPGAHKQIKAVMAEHYNLIRSPRSI